MMRLACLQAAQTEVDAANAAPELWKAQLTDEGIAGQAEVHAANATPKRFLPI